MTKDKLLSAKEILGTAPNENWMRVGMAAFVFGSLSMLGVTSVAGVEVGDRAQWAPAFVMLMGGCAMYYGTKLKKISIIMEREHEISMAKIKAGDK